MIAAIDPSDDAYTAQRALVGADAAFYICELLAGAGRAAADALGRRLLLRSLFSCLQLVGAAAHSDHPSKLPLLLLSQQHTDPSVAPRAAQAVAALVKHSTATRARLAVAGMGGTVERVPLNPCQPGERERCWAAGPRRAGHTHCWSLSTYQPVRPAALTASLPADFVDAGTLAALAPMLLSRQEAARDAATEAAAALCRCGLQGARGKGLVGSAGCSEACAPCSCPCPSLSPLPLLPLQLLSGSTAGAPKGPGADAAAAA